MNKKPINYYQTDPRWKNKRYNVSGGTMSIGGAGCGPTSAAMLIATITGKNILPTDTMEWDCKHGYMYLNQGTAYSYFVPQFKEYGISCGMINGDKYFGQSHSELRTKIEQMLHEGYYIIALMKKGLWTNGGHYVVLWEEYGGKVRINDPASAKDARVNGDPDLFFAQARHYWWVDAREFNYPKAEANTEQEGDEEDMTRYNTMAEIEAAASWAVPTIQKLCDKKAIAGGGAPKDDKGYPTDMNLTVDMIRMFVVNDRMGLYGK